MPEERIDIGVLARDVSVQVSTQVANTVAAAKTNELLAASASAEASRVSAEQGRVTAEQGRVTAEQGRVAAETARATEFAGFEDDIAAKLSKGDYDGTTGVGYADVADNLTPYSDESGAFQDNPVISQGTGTDNNVSIVTTGNFAQLREKQGNTLAIIQLFRNTNVSQQTVNGLTISRASDSKKIHIAGTASAITGITIYSAGTIIGNKYFVRAISNKFYALFFGQTGVQSNLGVITPATNSALTAYIAEGTTFDEDVEFDILDITSWPSDVIADLTANPDHFPWYYNGSLAYNAGSLENSDGVKLVCTKRQLFNGQMSTGYYWGNMLDGSMAKQALADRCCSDGYLPVIPNKPIHVLVNASQNVDVNVWFTDSNGQYISNTGWLNVYWSGTPQKQIITPPSGAYRCYFTFSKNVVNSSLKVTISLYYTPEEGGEGYSEHYDYEEPTVVDTGSEVLRSAGSAFDSKVPDGTVTRRIGVVDLGTLAWERVAIVEGGETLFYVYENISLTDIAKTVLRNMLCAKYDVDQNITSWAQMGNKQIAKLAPTSNRIRIRDDSYTDVATFTSAMSGVYLNYELDEPTTSEGTPFPENIGIDDYGLMYWLDENDELVGIPQGAKFFYPVSYKGFTDDLYARTEGDAGNVVIQSELEAVDDKHDSLYEIIQANVGGALRHQLVAQVTAGGGTLDFANTAYLDLGSLSWTKTSQNRFYTGTAGSIKAPSSDSQKANIICSVFKTLDAGNIYGNTEPNVIGTNSSGVTYLYVDATYYANHTADQLKADLKGVLLAYEKASS